MIIFNAKYTNMLTDNVKEVIIEVEELQIDREDIIEMGYKGMTHYVWSCALAKALENYPSLDYTFDSIELIAY